MWELGAAFPIVPESAYEPIWCGWGYGRKVTAAQITGTLAKAAELGFTWAVLDDGWQTAEGDWRLDPRKFPGGDADMKRLTDAIRAAGMKPMLWWAPLAADPGRELLTRTSRIPAAGCARQAGEDHLVERPVPVPGLPGGAGPRPRAGDEVPRRLGLRGAEARRPAPERRPSVFQPRPRPCAAERGVRAHAGAVSGDPAGGGGGQPGRRAGAVPLRDGLRVSFHALHAPGGGLGSRELLADPAQGQDAEGAGGAVGGVFRRPRRAERRW